MRRRPVQDVRIWSIQDRTAHASVKKPWLVRWSVDGSARSLSFRTRDLADRYRSRLLVAANDGEWFDRRTGEPESWRPPADQDRSGTARNSAARPSDIVGWVRVASRRAV